MPLPMPELPPVTSAFWPLSFFTASHFGMTTSGSAGSCKSEKSIVHDNCLSPLMARRPRLTRAEAEAMPWDAPGTRP